MKLTRTTTLFLSLLTAAAFMPLVLSNHLVGIDPHFCGEGVWTNLVNIVPTNLSHQKTSIKGDCITTPCTLDVAIQLANKAKSRPTCIVLGKGNYHTIACPQYPCFPFDNIGAVINGTQSLTITAAPNVSRDDINVSSGQGFRAFTIGKDYTDPYVCHPNPQTKVTLQGLNIRGDANDATWGGAIMINPCSNSLEVEVKDCFVDDMTGGPGGASGGSIVIFTSDNLSVKFTVDGCYFYGGDGDSGGALAIFGNTTAIVKNSQFISCNTDSPGCSNCGGAIIFQSQSQSLLVQNCSFEGNEAGMDESGTDGTAFGGAICSSGNLEVVGSTFINNIAYPVNRTKGGGQYPWVSPGQGGAIAMMGGTLKVKGNHFKGNLPNNIAAAADCGCASCP